MASIVKVPVLITVILLSIAAACAEPSTIEVIPLQHRTVDEMIPLLRSLVGEEGAVTGMGEQLIIRATEDRLDQIKDVVRRLDTPPRQLMISVSQDAGILSARDSAAFSGQLRLGARAADRPGRGPHGVLRGYVDTARTRSEAEDLQQLRVLEGRAALIQIGKSVPVSGEVLYGPGEARVYTDYVDLVSGFSVVPRVSGDRVMLDISPQHAAPSGTGEIDLERLHTTVSGRLGEWIDLGGAVESLTQRDARTAYTVTTNVEGRRRMLVKVEELR